LQNLLYRQNHHNSAYSEIIVKSINAKRA
jgi:hypothetical protein